MTDFLKQLAAKSLGAEEALQPRLPSLFEPIKARAGPLSDQPLQLGQAEEPVMPEAMGLDTLAGADALRSLVDRSPETRSPSRLVPGERCDMPLQAPTSQYPDASARRVSEAQRAHQSDMQWAPPSAFARPASATEQEDQVVPQISKEQPHQHPVETATQSILGEQVGSKSKQNSYAVRDESKVTLHYKAVLLGQDQPQSRTAVQRAAARTAPEFSSDTQAEPAPVRTKQSQIPATVVARPRVRRSVETPFKAPDESPAGISVAKPEPIIQVTIGRIEVRAMVSPPKQTPKPENRSPVMGLEEYLRHRSGGHDR